ncbi:Uncharacterised protein [Mycobacteroides abscessus subsp. abscessus]|nr:Uncharacterised protein [Mycobacteroides abscessus subsp. abscessus]
MIPSSRAMATSTMAWLEPIYPATLPTAGSMPRYRKIGLGCGRFSSSSPIARRMPARCHSVRARANGDQLRGVSGA